MIRSILVTASGSQSDTPVFETALAAARPLAAHLDFLHIVPTIGDATVNTPHADFAMGRGVAAVLERIKTEITQRSRAAEWHVRQFCERNGVPLVDAAWPVDHLSASWDEVSGDALECLTFRARHHDLVVMGRMKGADGLPSDLLELVLVRCGRPVLVAPTTARDLSAPAVVGWKETAESARALAAALPLLKAAKNVALVTVEEDVSASDAGKEGLTAAARQLAWHGIPVEIHFVNRERGRPAEVLASVIAERRASLLVMGAYGHARLRELVLGGCTQEFIGHAPVAVLLAA